jgi:ketosteroid isomerase-like protein
MSYEGVDEVREVCRRGLEASAGAIEFDVPDLRVRAEGDLAVAWGIDRIVADRTEVRSRATRVFERRSGDWQMIHQHLSFPLDEG